jgi:hypothetical protein
MRLNSVSRHGPVKCEVFDRLANALADQFEHGMIARQPARPGRRAYMSGRLLILACTPAIRAGQPKGNQGLRAAFVV